MKNLRIFLSLAVVLLLAACSNSTQLVEVNSQNELLATLESEKTGGTIAFYKGNPDEAGLLISEHSFNKTKESYEGIATAKDAAIIAGADYIVMTFGEKRIVKVMTDFDGAKGKHQSGHYGDKNRDNNGKYGNSELKAFYTDIADGSTITVELFTSDPSIDAVAVASFNFVKGNESRDAKRAAMIEVKSSLEAANLSFKDITHQRLSSGGQSIVIESRKWGGKRGNHRGSGSKTP